MTILGTVAESAVLAAIMVGLGAFKMWRLRRSEEKYDQQRRSQGPIHHGR